MAQALGFSAGQLQQLISEVQRQHEQQQGQQQGGEAAAAKRPRLDDAPPSDVLTLLDAAGEAAAAGDWQSNQRDGLALSDCSACCSAVVVICQLASCAAPRGGKARPPPASQRGPARALLAVITWIKAAARLGAQFQQFFNCMHVSTLGVGSPGEPAAHPLPLSTAAACLPALMPLASLPLLPLHPSGSGSAILSAGSGNVGGGHAFLPSTAAAAAAQDQRQQAQQQAQQQPQAQQQQQQPQAAAPLPPAMPPGMNVSGPELLLAALQHHQQQEAGLPAQLMQHHLQVGGSGHSGNSGDGSEDSAEDDGSAGAQAGARSHASARQPAAGRRSSEDKATANKEKNRRAQQRFRWGWCLALSIVEARLVWSLGADRSVPGSAAAGSKCM